MNGIWKNQEVKSLFTTVEECIKSGKSLKNAFQKHAQKFKRAEGSVRNYYYHEIDKLKNDEKRTTALGIDLTKHQKAEIQYFSKEEENAFYEKLQDFIKKGMSVRKACLTLAQGDGAKMLRYQNKYRALCKEREKKPDNIIRFTKRTNTISENELQALFAGLVRLVKRSAVEDAEAKVKEREERANRELRKMIAIIGEKDRQLEEIKAEILIAKKENEKLLQGLRRNSCLKAQILTEKSQKRNNA